MKRIGHLYEQVCSYDNLLLAAENARKGKNRQKTVQEFCLNLEENIQQIRHELITQTYKTSSYHCFIVNEPKERVIYRLPFRDRVVQWAIMLIVEPIWMSYFTRDTFSCIKGRGIHDALDRLRNDLRNDPEGTQYCLKIDVRKFYPSIDHDILKQVIRRKIKDPKLLWLIDDIIASVPEADGVPIGNYLSQFFANLYLAELDHLLKEECRVPYYYRYADDMVLLGSSKDELRAVLVYINHYLHHERNMALKGDFQIFPVDSRGVDFVGYISYHTHVRARKKNKQGLIRKVKELRKKGLSEEEIRIQTSSRTGFMIHCDSKHLLKTLNLVVGMKKFSELKTGQGKLDGSKLHIDLILGRPIRLLAYEVTDSKHNADKCLTIQYEIEQEVKPEGDGDPIKQWERHITFTGSKALINQLEGISPDDLPVEAKIIKQPIDRGKCFYKIVDPDE